MKAVQPAAKGVEEGVSDRIKRLGSGRKVRVLTQGLEDLSWLLEFDVEVPASAEGTHGRFLPMAFPADHADFGTIRALGERAGYAREMDVNPLFERDPHPIAYFSGSSSWYDGSTILYCFGRSTQS